MSVTFAIDHTVSLGLVQCKGIWIEIVNRLNNCHNYCWINESLFLFLLCVRELSRALIG